MAISHPCLFRTFGGDAIPGDDSPINWVELKTSADIRATVDLVLSGPRREVGFDRALHAEVSIIQVGRG